MHSKSQNLCTTVSWPLTTEWMMSSTSVVLLPVVVSYRVHCSCQIRSICYDTALDWKRPCVLKYTLYCLQTVWLGLAFLSFALWLSSISSNGCSTKNKMSRVRCMYYMRAKETEQRRDLSCFLISFFVVIIVLIALPQELLVALYSALNLELRTHCRDGGSIKLFWNSLWWTKKYQLRALLWRSNFLKVCILWKRKK